MKKLLSAMADAETPGNAIVHNGILDAGTDLLVKPFSIDTLAAKIAQREYSFLTEVLKDPAQAAVVRKELVAKQPEEVAQLLRGWIATGR